MTRPPLRYFTARLACLRRGSAGSRLHAAALWIVYVGGTQTVFDPKLLTIAPGDSVFFINQGGGHNVVADDNSFRCANGCDGDGNHGNGNISSANWLAKVTFAKAGTVGYFCEAHGQPGSGMFGTVVVQGSQPPPPVTSSIPALGGLAAVGLVFALVLATVVRLRGRKRPASNGQPMNPR